MMTLATSSSISRAEEDDAVLEQAAEDVPRALAAVRRLDDVRVDDGAARSLEELDGLRAVLGSLHRDRSGLRPR